MTIRVGLIGAGNITNTHAQAVGAVPDMEVAAIFGANVEKVESLGKQYSATPYHNLDEFLRHPLDMVIIGSPSGLHATHGIRAARRGLHVLVEKPIDVNPSRARALIAQCKQARVKLGIIFQDRLKSDIIRLKQLIDAGALGKLLMVDAHVKWYRPPDYYSGSRWRGTLALDGGGALMNQGIHTVDLLLWLLGDVVRVLGKTTTTLHRIEAEDTALALLEFSNGVVGTLQATTSAYPGYPRRLEITGTEGTVVLEHDRIVRADLRVPHEDLAQNKETDGNGSSSSPQVTDIRGHRLVIEDFVRAITQDATPVCSGDQGRRSVVVVQAIYRASRRLRAVSIRS